MKYFALKESDLITFSKVKVNLKSRLSLFQNFLSNSFNISNFQKQDFENKINSLW